MHQYGRAYKTHQQCIVFRYQNGYQIENVNFELNERNTTGRNGTDWIGVDSAAMTSKIAI